MITPTKEVTNIFRFLSVPVANLFITKLEEYNAIFGQQQLENIYHTFTIIHNKSKMDKYQSNVRNNILKCINWCNKYGLETNNTNLLID